ncbi:MAG: ABC transporter ATP-binding protein [Synergistaceae bacterium]|nr:ABC transporter ATP-binding protein [Synergistaceae bacterium]
MEITGLSLSLGGREILRGIDMTAFPGDFICVVGRNGAGKSTLLKCIAGIHRGIFNQLSGLGKSGKIAINGRDVSGMSSRDMARAVAYVPQSAPSDTPFKVCEFLEMSRYPWRGESSKSADKRAAEDAAGLAGVEDLMPRVMESLSGGERQRVMIAAALAQGASIMLMDEPTTYLDYACQSEIAEVMTRVNRERGATMIAVTHDVNMAALLAGSIVAMSHGRIEWQGTPNGLLAPERLERIFGVPFEQYGTHRGGGRVLVAPAAL